MLLVTCGYLAVLSIVLSTNSAQQTAGNSSSPVPVVVPVLPPNRRRQRRLQAQQQHRPCERGASYARFSSDLQRDDSIGTQQHRCREAADANGHSILPDLEFSDERISGTKRNRDGLNAMMAAAARGEFNVLYVFSLSRLARESIITMPLLKELVHTHHVRFISITEGIDSDRDGWEFIAAFMSLVHEHYLKDLGQNVLRGQEGALLAGYSVGDWCFGYGSEPVPGTEVKRRGRESKPRMAYKIDLETAVWVRRIFHWFVTDKRSLKWIVRELNQLKAPKDHRATTPHWEHPLVVNLLQNRKYIGIWPWGENYNERDPKTGDIRQLPRSDEECAAWTRYFPKLALIDEKVFEKAQKQLQENAEKYAHHRDEKGKLRGSNSDNRFGNPIYLVSGLFECAACGQRLVMGGSKVKYLFCSGYKKGICDCKTQLPKELAESLILNVIGEKVLASGAWFSAVWTACQQEWKSYCSTVPQEVQSVERELAEVDLKLQRLVDRIENGDDSPEITQRRSERLAQKAVLGQRLKKLKDDARQYPQEPSEEWLREQLAHLGDALRNGTPAAAHALKALVGGKIVVEQLQKPKMKSFFWWGTFQLSIHHVSQALGLKAKAELSFSASPLEETVTLDFMAPDSQEELMQKIRELDDQEYLGIEIAQMLGISKAWVTMLLQRSRARDSLEPRDGRKHRHELKRATMMPSPAEQLSQQVKELWDEDLAIQEIAQILDVDKGRVTAAVKFWFESRGLPVPDGRARRREIRLRKCSRP